MRAVQGSTRTARLPGRRRGLHPRNVAPPGTGQGHGRPGALWPQRAVPRTGGLRGRSRQRRLDRVLGCGILRPHRAPQPEPELRRVRLEVRHRSRRPVARGPGCAQGRGRKHRQRRGRRGRRRLRLAAQRDLDRRRGPGQARRRRRGRAHRDRRDQRSGRHRLRALRDGRLLLRTAEELRLRRRPLVRAVLPCGDRAGRAPGASDRYIPSSSA